MLSLLLASAASFGPTRNEAPPPPLAIEVKKDGQWRGLIGGSLSLTTGNTETTATLLNLDVSRQTQHTKTAVQAFLNHGTGQVDGQRSTTAQRWGLATQYDSDLTAPWFAFGKLAFEGDRLIQLTLRSVAAAGLGYHIVDTAGHTFNVFGGLSYTDRRYSTDQLTAGRQGRHFGSPGGLLGEESTHQINERLTLKQRLEFYPDFTRDKDHIARFNGTLNVSMTDLLSLSVNFVSTYNNNVPAGVKKTDTALFTGINIKLGH